MRRCIEGTAKAAVLATGNPGALPMEHRPPARRPRHPNGRVPRLLFIGEAVSLANVGRPLVLARWAREAGYEVHFACGEAYAHLARLADFEPIPLTTVVPGVFYQRLSRGRFFYSTAELQGYVGAEQELLACLRPDLVIGDFRLSLPVSASRAGIPLVTLSNAHWSPAAACLFPAPRGGLLGRMPPGLRARIFTLLRPLVLRHFAAPLNRMRLGFGVPALADFRALYTAGDWCAYLDLPEFLPLSRPLPTGHFHLGPVVWRPGASAPEVAVAPGRSGGLAPERPLAYVSLGSSGEKGVLPEVLRALVAQGCAVLLSGVSEPEQARLRAQVPGWDGTCQASGLLDPQAALARAVLCVCHGGSGTVYQALGAGLPLLCLPGNPDQGLVAQAVAAQGAGMVLEPEQACGRRLAGALEALQTQPSYRAQALRLASSIAKHDTRQRWLAFLQDRASSSLPASRRAEVLNTTLA